MTDYEYSKWMIKDTLVGGFKGLLGVVALMVFTLLLVGTASEVFGDEIGSKGRSPSGVDVYVHTFELTERNLEILGDYRPYEIVAHNYTSKSVHAKVECWHGDLHPDTKIIFDADTLLDANQQAQLFFHSDGETKGGGSLQCFARTDITDYKGLAGVADAE